MTAQNVAEPMTETWHPTDGDRVRTAETLTACESYTDYWRSRRRPNSPGKALDYAFPGYWMVLHDDGTEAPYDEDELRPEGTFKHAGGVVGPVPRPAPLPEAPLTQGLEGMRPACCAAMTSAMRAVRWHAASGRWSIDEILCSFCPFCGTPLPRAVPTPRAPQLASVDREALGRRVRDVWIAWAREQPNPKPSWLVPWEGLSEPDREVDRRIGETIAREAQKRPLAEEAIGADGGSIAAAILAASRGDIPPKVRIDAVRWHWRTPAMTIGCDAQGSNEGATDVIEHVTCVRCLGAWTHNDYPLRHDLKHGDRVRTGVPLAPSDSAFDGERRANAAGVIVGTCTRNGELERFIVRYDDGVEGYFRPSELGPEPT